jgi:hypothetical protein
MPRTNERAFNFSVRHRHRTAHDVEMRRLMLSTLFLLAACASEPKSDASVPAAFVKAERDCLERPMAVPRERQAVFCSCIVREMRKLTVDDIMAVDARQKEAASPRERSAAILENETTRRLAQQCTSEMLGPMSR